VNVNERFYEVVFIMVIKKIILKSSGSDNLVSRCWWRIYFTL